MAVSARAALLLAGCVAVPGLAHAKPIDIRQAVPKAGVQTDIGYPRIVVDGQGSDRYDSVVTRTVEVWITVSGDKPDNAAGASDGKLRIEGSSIAIGTPGAGRVYKIGFPYRAPQSATVANMRVSPVELCNDRLAKLSGAARAKALAEGMLFNYPAAWTAHGSIVWAIKDTKGVFKDPPALTPFSDSVAVGTSVECRALDRPKVRSKAATAQSGGATPRAKRMEPTIKSATLRIEPAAIQRIGNEMCPTELRLYGQVVTIRPFRGSAIILGEGFLSPITSLNFPSPGERSVRATYKLKWGGGAPGSLSGGGSAAPHSQTVSLRMNVANEDKKVIETASESVKVTCRKVQPTRVGSG